jgi:ankyrin repeat protein
MKFFTIHKVIENNEKTDLSKSFDAIYYSSLDSGNWRKLERFIKKLNKDDLNSVFGYKESLSHRLIHKAPISTLELALKKGLNVNNVNSYGRTALFYIRPDNVQDTEYVKKFDLLIKYGCNVNHTDESGLNFLMHSFDYLLAQRAKATDFNFIHVDNFGWTLINHIIEYESEKSVMFLAEILPLFDNIDYKDMSGQTPLLQATLGLHSKSLEVLLKHGADMTIRTEKEYPIIQSEKGSIPSGLTPKEIIEFFNKDRMILVPDELLDDETTYEILFKELSNTDYVLNKEK